MLTGYFSDFLSQKSYARENSNVILRELELSDNFVTRGSAIFIDNSNLSTFKAS